jgi:hypothetical protein
MTGKRTYSLLINHKPEIQLQLNTWFTQAHITHAGKAYTLRRKGFAGMNMQLRDDVGQLVLEVKGGSFWKSSRNIYCGKGTFELVWKMRPHQTWQVQQYGQEIVSYQIIRTFKSVSLEIQDNHSIKSDSWMFHALLFFTARAFQYVKKR